jgi:hypothetical protein
LGQNEHDHIDADAEKPYEQEDIVTAIAEYRDKYADQGNNGQDQSDNFNRIHFS